MKKIKNRFIKLFMAICLVFVSVFVFTQANAISAVFAKTNTDSEYVNTITEKSKEDARNLNELTDHLIKLIESDDKRFSFEFCAGGTMEIYDKEKEIGYAIHIAPIEYDEDGNAINL